MSLPRCALTLLLVSSWTGCHRAPPAANGAQTPRPSASAPAPPSVQQACPVRVTPRPDDNLANIQTAIDLAASGDCGEVELGPGSYEISAPIQLRSGLRLTGQRYKRTFSIIHPGPSFQGRALLQTKFAPESKERKQNEFYIENLRLDAAPSCPTRKHCPPPNVEVGIWLENTAYPTIRDAEFSRFPEAGAAIRGAGVLYLKLMDCRFLSNYGWSVDLALEYAPRKPGKEKANTYYAVSVGTIQRNYFASRRGIRLTPGYLVTIRDNQFEGGLSMIHAYESTSSVIVVENNYFEVSRTPQDVPGRATISLKGTGRVVGNLMVGPPKGNEGQYPGPAIEALASASMTIEDNTVRRFDPGVRINGVADPATAIRDHGNLIAPKARVVKPWDFIPQGAEPAPDEAPEPEPLERPESD